MVHVDCALRTIGEVPYATVATVCPDGTPWNTAVYTAFDSAFDFFWISDRESRHSANIGANPRVFLVIYDSTVPEGTGARKGVYIQARATELTDPEQVQHALGTVTTRAGKPPRPMANFDGPMPARLYRARPQRLWVNDALSRDGVRVDGRVEVRMDELRRQAATGSVP